MAKEQPAQFIVLPPRGLRDPMMLDFDKAKSGASALGLTAVARAASGQIGARRRRSSGSLRLLDSIHEDGAKLVAMTAEAARTLRNETPGLRIVPVVSYRPALRPAMSVSKDRPRVAGAVVALGAALRLKFVDRVSNNPVAGVRVVAFTNFAEREGAEGDSGANGIVRLRLRGNKPKIERLYVYSPSGFWGAFKRNIVLSDGTTISLRPIDLAAPDLLRTLYGATPANAGEGIKVGVIDSGIALDHSDLTVAGGRCTVTGEDEGDFGPSMDHGSHVGGIIAAHGSPPNGVRGVAPRATLMSYRVFGHGHETASNFAIAKAIDQAVADGCDLINMSLGGSDRDEATEDSILHAVANGCVVIAAAGNDGRQPVSNPARFDGALAVSAMGQQGTFPADSVEVADIMKPFATKDPDRFIAAFSNVGSEIDFTGAGVGIVSTVPSGHAVMSGTSMACPAVTGVAAWLMSQQNAIMSMPRDRTRAAAITQLLVSHAGTQVFGPTFEGSGLP